MVGDLRLALMFSYNAAGPGQLLERKSCGYVLSMKLLVVLLFSFPKISAEYIVFFIVLSVINF